VLLAKAQAKRAGADDPGNRAPSARSKYRQCSGYGPHLRGEHH